MSHIWVLQCFGYTAGLPWGDDPRVVDSSVSTRAANQELIPSSPEGHATIVIEATRWIRLEAMTMKPMTVPARVFVQRIGPWRQLISVVATIPNGDHRARVVRVLPRVDGLRLGSLALNVEVDPVFLQSACAITCGDPFAFTFDREERLALRRAITRVEDSLIQGEVQRRTVIGLPEELLVTSATSRLVKLDDARDEVFRQLSEVVRAEPWGYLWKERTPPTLRDAPRMLQSSELTPAMYETLANAGETMVRAIGLKPNHWSAQREKRAFEAITFTLVAARHGLPLEKGVSRLTKLLFAEG